MTSGTDHVSSTLLLFGLHDRFVREKTIDYHALGIEQEERSWKVFERELKTAWLAAIEFWNGLPDAPVTKNDGELTIDVFRRTMEGWGERGTLAEVNLGIVNQYALGLYRIQSVDATRVATRADSDFGNDINDYVSPGEEYKIPKIGVKVSFQQQHVEALNWLAKDQAFWLTSKGQQEKLWGKNVGSVISKTVQGGLEDGLGRKQVGRLLKEKFPNVIEPIKEYFDVVSSAGLVRSRTFGSVQGLIDGGAVSYRWVASQDERTCPICGALHGTVFDVSFASQQMGAILDAKDPDAIKEISPWVKDAKTIEDSTPAELQEMGVGLPPVHGRCRCTISVSAWK